MVNPFDATFPSDFIQSKFRETLFQQNKRDMISTKNILS